MMFGFYFIRCIRENGLHLKITELGLRNSQFSFATDIMREFFDSTSVVVRYAFELSNSAWSVVECTMIEYKGLFINDVIILEGGGSLPNYDS